VHVKRFHQYYVVRSAQHGIERVIVSSQKPDINQLLADELENAYG
jgi:hypothetical protein